MIDDVLARVTAALPDNPGILLAVSGGSDSMGLLHLFATLRGRHPMRLMVGFIDHGLRDGVEAERTLVTRAAERLDVPVLCAAVPRAAAAEAASAGSVQEWAREHRYRMLTAMAAENGLIAVATGHTCDDQAETVMLRLLRGCGVDGLQGMAALRPLAEGITLFRPLLDISRRSIRAYLAREGVPYADDPSNENPRFLRVRVRNELLPLMASVQPGVSRRLCRLAQEAGAVVDFLEQQSALPERGFRRLRLGEGIKVRSEVFDGLPPGLWGRVIRRALRELSGSLRRFERCHIATIEAALARRGSTGALPLPGAVEAHVCNGNLYLFKSPLPSVPAGVGHPTAEGAGQWRVRFAALGALAEIHARRVEHVDGLEVRARRPGDRLFGSEKRFKEVLIRAKVPRPYRDFVPVLALGDRIIACPGFVPSRKTELEVRWLFDEDAPFLDIDFT